MDLNVDMGELVQSLLKKNNGAGGSSPLDKILPFKNAILLLTASVAVSAIYAKYYWEPMKEKNLKTSEEINRLVDMRKQTEDLEKKIANLKKNLSASKEQYLESLSHFGNSEDLGELYRSISILATKYDLIVLNIKELPPAPPPEPKKDANGKIIVEQVDPNKIQVKEVKVEAELKGKYNNYIKFKEDLAVAEMLLKVNSENIVVKNTKEEQGKIFVKLNLSTYAINKSNFTSAIANNDEKKDEK